MSIRIGILGYGNLGKGVELAIKDNEDMELVAIFTRREVSTVKTYTNVEVISVEEIEKWKDKIDVLILCGGSATDLPMQSPIYSKIFNIVDSFDTHKNIWNHFNNVDKAAKEGKKVGLISCGWDPGIFSLNRLMSESFLPNGNTYTFWGKGVSQGHSDAIRRIEGVKEAVQYTIPIEESIDKVKNGENPIFTERQKHLRQCFVVVDKNANKEKIKEQIINMPNYFLEYDTTVEFISHEEFMQNHKKMPHGGFVIRSGKTGSESNTNQVIEFSLKLESNPEFTANVLLAYARAVYRIYLNNDFGAKTVFDIPPSLLSQKDTEKLIKELL